MMTTRRLQYFSGVLALASTFLLGAWVGSPQSREALKEVRTAEGPVVPVDHLFPRELELVRLGQSYMDTFTAGRAQPAGCELLAGGSAIHCWGFGYNCVVYMSDDGVEGACIKCNDGYCW